MQRVEQLISRVGLPIRGPSELNTEQMLQLMAVDKKVIDGGLRLVLLNAIGDAVVTGDFNSGKLRATLDSAHARAVA